MTDNRAKTPAGGVTSPREAELLASERRFLEKLERLLAIGQPGVKQAKREIAARLGVHLFAKRLYDLSRRVGARPRTGAAGDGSADGGAETIDGATVNRETVNKETVNG